MNSPPFLNSLPLSLLLEHVALLHIFREQSAGGPVDGQRRSGRHVLQEVLFVLEEAQQLAAQNGVVTLPGAEGGTLAATLQFLLAVHVSANE